MRYIAAEDIARAKEMDLLTYLRNYEPQELVHTVEGNSGDSCRVNQYSVGHYEILGYGVPKY